MTHAINMHCGQCGYDGMTSVAAITPFGPSPICPKCQCYLVDPRVVVTDLRSADECDPRWGDRCSVNLAGSRLRLVTLVAAYLQADEQRKAAAVARLPGPARKRYDLLTGQR